MSQFSFQRESSGCLYLVPTPIGNLEDMTYRAVRILGEVDQILAEDTRQTIKLLKHYEIDRPLRSFHDHSAASVVDELLTDLESGQVLALVSDAGMPLINDPGHPLVQACLAADIPVIALPGPNAALTALIASGLAADRFTYYGFFPRKAADQVAQLEAAGRRSETALYYESPHRLTKSLKQIQQVLGPETQVVVARELTKRYEEYLRGSVSQVLAEIANRQLKGEMVLLVEGDCLAVAAEDPALALNVNDHVQALIDQGKKPNAAIKEVARMRQLDRREVYRSYHQL